MSRVHYIAWVTFGTGAILEPHHKYLTQFETKVGSMAPPKADNLITQLFAKVEEGNLDARRCMETIQTCMTNMEATVKGVMKDHDEMQKWLWHPVVEAKKVQEMTDAIKMF